MFLAEIASVRFRAPRNDARVCSVVVARYALLGDALILDGGGEHHAVGELLDHGALNLLPGRLARREMEAALLVERGATGRELVGGDQNVGGTAVEVDADAVASL